MLDPKFWICIEGYCREASKLSFYKTLNRLCKILEGSRFLGFGKRRHYSFFQIAFGHSLCGSESQWNVGRNWFVFRNQEKDVLDEPAYYQSVYLLFLPQRPPQWTRVAICKEICKLQAGRIWLDFENNIFICFHSEVLKIQDSILNHKTLSTIFKLNPASHWKMSYLFCYCNVQLLRVASGPKYK